MNQPEESKSDTPKKRTVEPILWKIGGAIITAIISVLGTLAAEFFSNKSKK